MDIREPAVAGRFYPAQAKELRTELQVLFSHASSKKSNRQAALIVPHAGYVFSGGVAAEAFNSVADEVSYKRVFVIGSSHTTHFSGASVYDGASYRTPLGDIPLDKQVIKRLLKEKMVHFLPQAHEQEHSLEVQMPFIQYKWSDTPPVIPLILGDMDLQDMKHLAEVLRPYFNKENLFVISTDFSHYPAYEDAVVEDDKTANAIISNDPDKLRKHLHKSRESNIAGLATPLCGWTAVLTLLHLTSEQPVTFRKLKYRNSGDSKYGGKQEVVGYWAISVDWNEADGAGYSLSDIEKRNLLDIARDRLKRYFKKKKGPDINEAHLSKSLMQSLGAFVSVYCKDELRGCVGAMTSKKPLYELVQDMIISAAVNDSRFADIIAGEIEDVKIEISVLTPLKKISDISEVVPGKHGVYVTNGWQTGTLLPQVAEKMNWDSEQLLGHTARDKAGMTWDGWKEADVYTYEAIVFKD